MNTTALYTDTHTATIVGFAGAEAGTFNDNLNVHLHRESGDIVRYAMPDATLTEAIALVEEWTGREWFPVSNKSTETTRTAKGSPGYSVKVIRSEIKLSDDI